LSHKGAADIPAVSVIIPVYNSSATLEECLDSVIGQTFSDIEIVCVNDGSTDDSESILVAYESRDERVTLVNRPNGGLSAARNTGIEACCGEYIVFLDSDDTLDPETVETALEAAREHGADAVLWGYVREFENQSKPKALFEGGRVFDEAAVRSEITLRLFGLTGKQLKHPEDANTIVTAWGKLLRASIIKENALRFIDTKEIGTEDALFNIEYFIHARKAVYVDWYFTHYRKTGASSLTYTYKRELPVRWLRLYEKMNAVVVEHNLGEEFRLALRNRIAMSIIGLGLNITRSGLTKAEKKAEIDKIFSEPVFSDAAASFSMRWLPPVWKVFFFFVKMKQPTLVLPLLEAMNSIIGS